ncbi:sigma-70 family RNA polymerase sigma factor [Pseudomonas subflava]|uniref:sigma-70 family RNA polymerase sigma factor n=1 Tax=Pseudomonas subflava TaxID=2952933 RepID=UPI00207B0AF4
MSSSKLGFFFSEHRRWLLQYLQRQVRHRADAKDTAAETFCQLLAAKVDPETIEQPRAYLSTIARRLVFDRHRRRRLEQAYLERLALLPEELAPSPEDRFLLLEALSAIDRVLTDLPLVVKKAFLLSQLDGLGYAEIGRRLEVSERTVGRYMTQALRQCYLTGAQP